MSDELTTAPVGASGEVAPAEPKPSTAMVSMTAEQLKSRLDEEREKSRTRLLKDLGFEKADDAKNAFKALKELQDAQLSEQQRAQKQIEELKPQAARSLALEAQLAALVDEQFAALPEATQKVIDAVANGNAEKRLELIRVVKSVAVPASASAQSPAAPAPVSTASGAAPPRVAATKNKHDELKELERTNPYAASIFYAANQSDIERDRPAS